MSLKPQPGRHSLQFLGLAGCCSALLTVGIAGFPYLNQYFLGPGLSLGLLIPLYFARHAGAGFAWRFAAYLLASIAAFEAALCAAFLIRVVWPGNLNDPVTVPALFAGGVVGGFILLMAGTILFGWSEDKPGVLRVFAASLATGVLGVAGWYAGRMLRLGSSTPPGDFWRMNTPEFISLHIVWQTGTALLLGWVVTGERALSPGSLPLTAAPLRPRASMTKIAVGGLFFSAVFGFLGWFFVRDLQNKRYVERSDQEFKAAAARRDQVLKQYIAETPPVDGLPPIEKLGIGRALILEEIAGFRPEGSTSVDVCRQQAPSKGTAPQPPCVIYDAAYRLLNQPETPPLYPVRIRVRVTQYPNAAWARHKGRGYTGVLDDPQSVTVTSGSRTDLVMRTTRVDGAGLEASYVWPSGSIVVQVDGRASLPGDFLRRYLAKYPSSL